MEKAIPAFYCCYLLRSTVRHGSLYVGSTPNPVRRLRQHNGQSKGGAVRTARDTLRPWEMACIVTGFPSKVAALQFEWAWQNTHLTRHIPADDRITATRTAIRISPRTGRARKRPARPRLLSLTDRLSNLHLLLRVKSFERWPLRVTFFSEDVHRVWEKWTKTTPFRLRDGISVELDKAEIPAAFRRPDAETQEADTPRTIANGKGIEGIEVGYENSKAYLEKSTALLEQSQSLACGVCNRRLQTEKPLTVVCPEEGCRTVSHLTCLSRSFLLQEGKPDAMVPLQGQCPGCRKTLQWSSLMTDLSLRTRGQKEVASLFGKRRRRAASPAKSATAAAATTNVDGEEHSASGSEARASDDDLPPFTIRRDMPGFGSDDYEDVDEWYYRRDEMDVDVSEEQPAGVRGLMREESVTMPVPAVSGERAEAMVIEDSDWDDAEVLD